MIILASMLTFFGFYTLYRTSKRVEFKSSEIQKWVRQNIIINRAIGLIMLVGSFYFFVHQYGFGAGIFIAIVLLMTLSSLIIIFSPLTRPKR